MICLRVLSYSSSGNKLCPEGDLPQHGDFKPDIA
jgi:hypothetical protein